MQHTDTLLLDAQPARLQLSPHVPADALQRRLNGMSATALAADLRTPLSGAVGLSRALCDAHASADDLADLRASGGLPAARIRSCICCSRQIISAHAGVRMCRPCRLGDIDWRF